jgi:hypothetical protein
MLPLTWISAFLQDLKAADSLGKNRALRDAY